MFSIILITPDGKTTEVARATDEKTKVGLFAAARAVYFGRKGTVSFTRLIAKCKGCTIQVKQGRD